MSTMSRLLGLGRMGGMSRMMVGHMGSKVGVGKVVGVGRIKTLNASS